MSRTLRMIGFVLLLLLAGNSVVAQEATKTPASRNTAETETMTGTELSGTSGGDCSVYLEDVTLPDGTSLDSGSQQTKTWRVINCGEKDWKGYQLTQVFSASVLNAWKDANPDIIFPIDDVSAGEEAEVSLTFTAPEQSGTYVLVFEITTDQGYRFGDPLYLVFVVK